MKNLFLTLLLGAAAAPAALAQARAGGNLSSIDYASGSDNESHNTGFGIKGGYNLSNIYGSGKDLLNSESLNAFHGGVYGQFGFNEFSSLQIELLYSRKGYLTNFPAFGQRATRLDYLELPVLYVGNLTSTLSFHIGPQVSVLTNARLGDQSIAIADGGFNTLDFGGVAGLEARIGPAHLGARYDLGLGNVYKDGVTVRYNGNKVVDLTNTNIHNQTFQVYLSLGFTQ